MLVYDTACPWGGETYPYAVKGEINSCLNEEAGKKEEQKRRMEAVARQMEEPARKKEAEALCRLAYWDRPRFPAGTCGAMLESESPGPYALLLLLEDRRIQFLEVRVSPSPYWHETGSLGAIGDGAEFDWTVDQDAGQYMRLQLAPDGAPGCLADRDLQTPALRASWDAFRDRAYFRALVQSEGPKCLWLGKIKEPVATLRLVGMRAESADPQDGDYWLIDAQTRRRRIYRASVPAVPPFDEAQPQKPNPDDDSPPPPDNATPGAILVDFEPQRIH
ncbi:MAG: hypothetical protein LBP52_06620 [Burkholderiaceae bacterium]|nr:hypothetical protein [Burkholderiaceae bacterium]